MTTADRVLRARVWKVAIVGCLTVYAVAGIVAAHFIGKF